MSDISATPEIGGRKPIPVNVELGKSYWWCACGRSRKQPFCDGSHKGTGITPIKVNLDEDKKVAWCGCKHSKNKPYCDGSHRNL